MAEPFRFTQRVRYHECDPQGVVFNANYLTYFDVTMTELWRELGGYQAMVEAGVDMVVAEARILYRSRCASMTSSRLRSRSGGWARPR